MTQRMEVQATQGFAWSHEYSFAQYLDTTSREETGLTKGERTRLRLKAAAARCIETQGYYDMQTRDISQDAGLSPGAIYTYFENKEAITFEVITEFVNHVVDLQREVKPREDVYEWLHEFTLLHVRLFSKNAGLVRCWRQLNDHVRAYKEFWHQINGEWFDLLAEGLRPGYDTSTVGMKPILNIAHMVSSLIDEYLHHIFIRSDSSVAFLAISPERLAEVLSIVAYRMAFASDPDPAHFSEDNPLLALNDSE